MTIISRYLQTLNVSQLEEQMLGYSLTSGLGVRFSAVVFYAGFNSVYIKDGVVYAGGFDVSLAVGLRWFEVV